MTVSDQPQHSAPSADECLSASPNTTSKCQQSRRIMARGRKCGGWSQRVDRSSRPHQSTICSSSDPLRLHAAHRDWSERLGDGARAGLQPLNALQNAACREPLVPLCLWPHIEGPAPMATQTERSQSSQHPAVSTQPGRPQIVGVFPSPSRHANKRVCRIPSRPLWDPLQGRGLGHSRCSGAEGPPPPSPSPPWPMMVEASQLAGSDHRGTIDRQQGSHSG